MDPSASCSNRSRFQACLAGSRASQLRQRVRLWKGSEKALRALPRPCLQCLS